MTFRAGGGQAALGLDRVSPYPSRLHTLPPGKARGKFPWGERDLGHVFSARPAETDGLGGNALVLVSLFLGGQWVVGAVFEDRCTTSALEV